jgi:hypothetical protein
VTGPGHQPVLEHRPAHLKEDHRGGGPSPEQVIPVGALERGARDHGGLARRDPLVHPAGDRAQPRLAVGVGQRYARPHLGDIRRRVESVRVGEAPVELSREQCADGRLTAAGHPGDDEDHWRNDTRA